MGELLLSIGIAIFGVLIWLVYRKYGVQDQETWTQIFDRFLRSKRG